MDLDLTKWFVEVRADLVKVRSNWISLADLAAGDYTGFRTVFAKQTPGSVLYLADQVFVDFDNNESAARRAVEELVTEGISVEVWDSGGRSIHLHIACEPAIGPDTPARVKYWVAKHCPGADLSIYNPKSIFRLPRTWHADHPGHKKKLLASHDGRPLTIPPLSSGVGAPVHGNATSSIREDYNGDEVEIRLRLLESLLTTMPEGRRGLFVSCVLCKDMLRLGLTYEDALDKILRWNEHYAVPPLEESEIYERVTYTYNRGLA